jgi:diguanylate cyclase (GGDEF)-like protein
MEKKNILVIMSDPQMLRTVNRELRKQYEIVPMTTAKDARQFLVCHTTDLILMDLNEDYEEEHKMIRFLRLNAETEKCPIVLLRKDTMGTGGRKSSETDVLKLGASDVLRKPFSFETLRHALTRLLRKEAEALQKKAEGGAYTSTMKDADGEKQTHKHLDRTTGLMNRSTFMEKVSSLLAEKGEGALLLLDIDGLKRINDLFGQKAGDELIRRFSVLLRGCFEDAAKIANLGGDDFAVFLPYKGSHEYLQSKAEEILFRVKNQISAAQIEQDVTVSIGISVAPEHGKSYDRLFSAAEDALVFVKNHGKGFSCFGFGDGDRAVEGIDYHEETKKPQRVLLARRKTEESQCWVKMGEYRLIWANNLRIHELYGIESLSVLFTLKREKNLSLTRDELEFMAGEIRTYFTELGTKAVFSWYSEKQFFMMFYRPKEAGEVILRVIADLPMRLHGFDVSVQYEMMSTSGHSAVTDRSEGGSRER